MSIAAGDVLFPVAGYLIGSIPFGWLVARSKGIDITQHGSGNVGATNIGRVLGKPYGVFVLICDALKGALPVLIAAINFGKADAVAVATGLAAILGHVYSVFLGFRGGKGVATGLGVVLALAPFAAGFGLLAFFVAIFAGWIMSVAAVVGAVTFAIAQVSYDFDPTLALFWFAKVAAALVVWRHRSNLVRVCAGTEARLSDRPRMQSFTQVLHTLALCIWLGAGWFFSAAVAPKLFATFEAICRSPPEWLPLGENLPADMGSRLAGSAVGPIFPIYFLMQAICGVIVVGSACGWAAAIRSRATCLYAMVASVALLLVAIGWPISQHVSVLRLARFSDDAGVAEAAKASFATWHLISLALNLLTLTILVVPVVMWKRLDVTEASTPTNP